jgi:hypothetical protein
MRRWVGFLATASARGSSEPLLAHYVLVSFSVRLVLSCEAARELREKTLRALVRDPLPSS